VTAASLYHLCPDDVRDSALISLNELARRYPDIHRKEREKWQGRESVLDYQVPHLDVTWGDTVNLSPIDPRKLLERRAELGLPPSRLLERSVVRIPLERIDGLPAVWYTGSGHWRNSRPGDPSVPATPPPEDFTPFEASRYRELDEVPGRHEEYLRAQRDLGEPALAMVFVPHVLVHGRVDLTGLAREKLPQRPV
jgi:hypothetical protein